MAELKPVVYVRYRDHVLFRNADHTLYKPSLRETIGWLHKENPEAVWILWERSLTPLPHEKIQPQQSGMVLLKSDIIEMRRLPLRNIQNNPPLRLKTQDGLPYGCQVGDRRKSGTKNLAKAAEGKENHGTR
jgi:hypothetical protein